MKKLLTTISTLLLIIGACFSQCNVNNDVQDNYLNDAWTLVFREFAGDPSNPDYQVPILDPNKTIPYLEKISAIYNLAATNEVADSLFNKFEIHTSSAHPDDIVFGQIGLLFEEEVSWLQDFIATGISGVPALDQLMANYQFVITGSTIVDPGGYVIEIKSDITYLNHFALLDEFLAVDGIDDTFPYQGGGFNYTGIPFLINGEEVVAGNIVSIPNGLRFSLHVDWCGNTCEISKGWDVLISEDCSQVTIEALTILNNLDFTKASFNIYPNPVDKALTIQAKNISIKSITIRSSIGTVVKNSAYLNDTIDVSNLTTGLYFIELISSEGQKYLHKFLKK